MSFFRFTLLLFICTQQSLFAQWTFVPSGTSHDLYDVQFPSPDTGYAVGYYGTILKTTNGGASWAPLTSGAVFNLESVYFLDNERGFVAGENGIMRTVNGGQTWETLSIPVSEPLYNLVFTTPTTGFACGDGGVILKTTDGGSTWTVKPSGSGRSLASLSFPNPNTGYAVAKGYNWEFLKTTDAGETWSKTDIHPIVNASNLETVWFMAEETGLIGGWYIAALIKTTDGGNSWLNTDVATTTGAGADLYDLFFPSQTTGYGVGWGGTIYKTTDSGNTWSAQPLPGGFTGVLYAAFFSDDNNGVAVGAGGTIVRTTTGGTVSSGPEIQARAQPAIFPNPAINVLYVEKTNGQPESVPFELFDRDGRKVLSQTLNQPLSKLDLSALPPGVYTYRYNGTVVGKVVIGDWGLGIGDW